MCVEGVDIGDGVSGGGFCGIGVGGEVVVVCDGGSRGVLWWDEGSEVG